MVVCVRLATTRPQLLRTGNFLNAVRQLSEKLGRNVIGSVVQNIRPIKCVFICRKSKQLHGLEDKMTKLIVDQGTTDRDAKSAVRFTANDICKLRNFIDRKRYFVDISTNPRRPVLREETNHLLKRYGDLVPLMELVKVDG